MAKAEKKELKLHECKDIAERVRVGFETGIAVADTVGADAEPALDGMIGSLLACRSESTLGWLLEVLTRVRDERDKAQTELEMEGGGEEG